jgi:hypothetical protein
MHGSSRGYATIAFKGVLSDRVLEASVTPFSQFRGHLSR